MIFAPSRADLNVRSVRSPATTVRTLASRNLAKCETDLRSASDLTDGQCPCKGPNFGILRPYLCQWRRWESNPRP